MSSVAHLRSKTLQASHAGPPATRPLRDTADPPTLISPKAPASSKAGAPGVPGLIARHVQGEAGGPSIPRSAWQCHLCVTPFCPHREGS
mmetsp:Transcript_36404/g.102839  ORF Transcript_36404/g.102839 Transcript_36404/m.102839 type:complete len:89 (+) Transcript_36404:240-506(+)